MQEDGGSIEDLWPFNEEITARAIFESKIPIISAIGHETDFTIADFVADLRAPTPSAAAELAVADIEEVNQRILTYQNRLKQTLKKKIEIMKLEYKKIMASRVFTMPLTPINEEYQKLDGYLKDMTNMINIKLKESQKQEGNLISKLDALSPLKTLSRGYTIAQKDGNIIKSVKNLKKDDIISLKFQDGNVDSKIIKMEENV